MDIGKWALRGGLAVSGVLLGLALTEAAFWFRDDGAFPHVNLYVPDAQLGTRLMPDASQRIAFAGNPTTSLHTNGHGYRGADWLAPDPSGPGEILVVGDSQVFGLGVEGHQTASAQLEEITSRPVLNGGVPTYGPEEYLAVVEEVLEAREGAVKDVVIVVNFSNDLFELTRPNRERHGVWDGWAVRIESMPESTTWFPGRDLLYRQSHAFFALRKWSASGSALAAQSLPSEGGLDDLVVAGREVATHRAEDGAAVAQSRRDATKKQAQAASELGAPAEVADLANHVLFNLPPLDDTDSMALRERAKQATAEAGEEARGYAFEAQEHELAQVARKAWLYGAQPGDIVHAHYAEASRPVPVTAELLALGAREAKDLRARIERADGLQHRLGARGMDVLVGDANATIDASASTWVSPERRSWSPLEPWLVRARDVVEAHGASLTVVALPLDVQVLDSQWEKYGVEPVDMSESLVLLEDLADAGHRAGIRVVQPRNDLAAVGDGAWLDGDLHLSAVGQRTLAESIARRLGEPPPPSVPGPGLPEGRSLPPLTEEWLSVEENYVRHSTPERCQTRRVREWLRVDCRDDADHAHTGLDLSRATLEAWGVVLPGRGATAFLPLIAGRDQDVLFLRDRHTATLEVRWKEDGTADLGLERRGAEGSTGAGVMAMRPELFLSESPLPIPGTMAFAEDLGLHYNGTPHLGRWVGWPAERCAAVEDRHGRVARCVLDATSVDLPCAEGTARAGGAGHCLPLCGPDVPCERGECTSWQGGRVCL